MHTAYIGMGSNMASWAGPPEATLAAAALCLESLGRVVGRSSLYSTAPVGFHEQPRFVNAVVALLTELEPRQLLDALLEIEQEFGRDRTGTDCKWTKDARSGHSSFRRTANQRARH